MNFNPDEQRDKVASERPLSNKPAVKVESDTRVPVGSDYDLDKVKVKQATTSTGISFADICASMVELHDRKNADYGDAFTKSMNIFGSPYLVSRLHDKVQRLINLSLGAEVQDKEETVLDKYKGISKSIKHCWMLRLRPALYG